MKIINLLPKTKQKELRYEMLFHSILTAAIFGFVSLMVVVFLEVGLGVYLDHQRSAIVAQIETTKKLSNKDENTQLKAAIDAINLQLKDYQDLSSSAPLWSKALRSFSADVPDGVKITTFNSDSIKKQVDIGGFAPTREQVISLYNQINADTTHFRDINYPLENVAKATDVNFHFTFFVQDSVLQPSSPQPEGSTK